jgi:HK97 family phage major capsid protein
MSKLNELREQRSTLAKNLRNLLDQNPGKSWTPELQAKYDAGLDDIGRIDAELDRHQRILDLEADKAIEAVLGAKPGTRQGGNTERDMYAQWLRNPESLTAEQWGQIRNTMSTGTGSQGGYTVQSEVAAQLIDALKDYSAVRRVATILQTAKGNPLSFPTSDGTAETGELIAENTTATAADPSFGTAAVNAYKFSSKIVAVPLELLQDAEVDIEEFVNRRLGERIGRSTNAYFTTGSGSSQPYGVMTQATIGKTGIAGQTTSVIADDLIDLVHSVDAAYRLRPCGFMLNDASFGKVRKLKDSQNRPIFIPGWDGLGKPMPDQILGYPVTVNPDCASMAANALSIAFGDFSKYVVRDALAVTVFRFTDSAYIKLGQVAFLAWHRSGGNLLDTAAVKTYKNSAT